MLKPRTVSMSGCGQYGGGVQDSEAAEVRRVTVSGRVVLIRAATGFGLVTAMVAVVGLLWPGIADLALIAVVFGGVRWMYEREDRHSTWAAITGGVTAVLAAIAAAMLLHQGQATFSTDVAYAALGVLAGSQVYAAVTRRP